MNIDKLEWISWKHIFIVLLKIQDFRSVVSPTYGLLIGILLHILLLLLIFAKLSIPLQTSTMEDLEFVPIDNWTEYHAKIQETEKSLNSSIHQLIQDYHGVPCGLLIIGIPLHILGIIQQVFIVIYERYQMDPMKRSLTNQVYLSLPISDQ